MRKMMYEHLKATVPTPTSTLISDCYYLSLGVSKAEFGTSETEKQILTLKINNTEQNIYMKKDINMEDPFPYTFTNRTDNSATYKITPYVECDIAYEIETDN